VAAFGRLAPLYPDWKLVLMGEFLPPYSEEVCRARCRELGIEDRVEIAGVLRGERKAAEFFRSHLFVFASVAPYESFGLVMAEAMMWGLPLLASNWRGNRDVAGAAAEYFEVGSLMEANLAAKLQVMLEDTRLRDSLAARSRARFVSEFRQRKSQYSNLVARLIGVEADV
jgi:glycosyltransferase involved in cell wall biosynthesis